MNLSTERSEELAAMVGLLRRLLGSPADTSAAWDCLHEVLTRHPEFVAQSVRCTHPALIAAVEAAMVELTGRRFPVERLALKHAESFGLVHGVGVAGGSLVCMVFCEDSRRGLVALPFLNSGELVLMHLTVSSGDANFVMTPASC